MPNYRQSTGTASTKAMLTSERIAADIAEFNKSGGHIEVLGNTPFHHRPKEIQTSLKANGEAIVPGQSADQK